MRISGLLSFTQKLSAKKTFNHIIPIALPPSVYRAHHPFGFSRQITLSTTYFPKCFLSGSINDGSFTSTTTHVFMKTVNSTKTAPPQEIAKKSSSTPKFHDPIKHIIDILLAFPNRLIDQITMHRQTEQAKQLLIKHLVENKRSLGNEKFGAIFYNHSCATLWTHNNDLFKTLVIKDMAQNQHLWKKRFNISVEDLINDNDKKIFYAWS